MAKRGRPRTTLLSIEHESLISSTYPDVRTIRSLRNKARELEAFGVIKKLMDNGEKLDYLMNDTDTTARWGVLRALGYFPSYEIPELARYICETQAVSPHTVREWEAILRQARLGISETVSENVERN